MMGFLGLIGALAVAVWLLVRAGRGKDDGKADRAVQHWKLVVFLGLAAALFAAKLWPLAFMVLVAAGGVTAIEVWRDRAIRSEAPPPSPPAPAPATRMSREEAASVLGVAADASVDEVRAAHRRLISQLHPDKGGSDYLASKINQARDVLAGDA